MYRYLALAAAVLIAMGGWWYFMIVPASRSSVIETPPVTIANESQWQWQFDPAGEDANGIPKTNVTLRNGATSYAIGTMEGNCFDIAQSVWKLLAEEGELAGAICWFAGGGTEIGVFSEEGKAVIKIGDVDEGTAEESGMRGNFKTLFTIDFGFIRGLEVSRKTVLFDAALWLTGAPGEDAAISAGLCTEETRAECLPNDYYIYNQAAIDALLPLASNLTVYMLTWHAETEGVKREFIKLDEFAQLVNDQAQHWNKLPYNVTIKNGEVIMIEEVYVP